MGTRSRGGYKTETTRQMAERLRRCRHWDRPQGVLVRQGQRLIRRYRRVR